MLEDKNNTDYKVDRLEKLLLELKRNIELRSELIKLDLTDKLTRILSGFLLILFLSIIGLIVLFNCSFALAYAIDTYLNDMALSFVAVGGIFLVLALCIYWMRNRLITQPIVNFLARLLLEKDNKK